MHSAMGYTFRKYSPKNVINRVNCLEFKQLDSDIILKEIVLRNFKNIIFKKSTLQYVFLSR